jgi:hypothetical protein
MPTVIASAVVAAVGLTGVAATIATAAVGFASSMAINALTVRPSGRKAQALTASERSEMIRSATAARRVVYGQARVSGPIAFAYTIDGPTGYRNSVLHLLVPLAGHEIASISDIIINDEKFVGTTGAQGWVVPPAGSRHFNGKFYDGTTASLNFFQWRAGMGSAAQTADAFLLRDVPVWSVQHRLRGVAYLYARLYWNSTVWGAGLPNLSAIIRGRLVFDPRTGQTGWSDNPALCIRDYLLASFGMNCAAEEIDEESFIAAANLCDELVPVTGGGEQKRYTCNGVLALDEKPIDIMERLLSSCAGALVYSQGRYRLYPAAYRSPQLTIDASYLRGAVKVRPQPPRKERANTVQGTFIDPARGWIAAEFTPVTNAAYRAADGGERIGRDLELGFTSNASTAQRLARLQLERSRRALTIELPCTMAAIDVAVMEPVRVTLPELGWSEKVFVPIEWTLSPDGGIDLVLQEDDPAIYAWDGGSASVAPPEVVLPGLYPEPPLLTLNEEVSGSNVQLIALIASLPGASHARYEIEYRRSADANFQTAGSGEQVAITVTAGETYEVRARSVNLLGITSEWTARTRQVLGSAAPPGDVAALIASLLDGTLYLDWAAPTGLVSYYRLRWSPLLSGAEWSSAIDVASRITNVRAAVPARQGSYLLKAVDALGRESANAAMHINRTPDARGSNVVATLTEHPGFAGSKTNCAVNGSNQLLISSLSAFDAQGGNFDSPSANFDTAGGGALAEGVYEFASKMDLGAKFVARLSANVRASVQDLVADVDGAPGEFDGREGVFDGSAPSAVDVVIEVATTDTDPNGVSPTWSAWQVLGVGDYVARGFKFRARLTTSNPMATPLLEQLSVQADMPDRVAAAGNLTSAPGGDTISFSPAFYATPAISVSAANLASGDYAVITARSRAGFTVQFRNSAGTGVARSYDWVARGFGREQ